jgi:hypothetical protein
MFVPVYLQAHFLLKTIFCGIYVIFYRYNIVRAVILTAINISLLALNTFMKVSMFNILLFMGNYYYFYYYYFFLCR